MANIWNNLKGRRKCMRKHFKTTFFAQYPLFWKFAFTVCAKEFISYQKYLITKVFKTFSAFVGDRINMEKLIFVSHFCFWKIMKSFPSIVNFFLLFSILRIDPFYIFEAMMYVSIYNIRHTLHSFQKIVFSVATHLLRKMNIKVGFFLATNSRCATAIISFTILQYYSIGKDGKKGGNSFFRLSINQYSTMHY